MSIIWHLLLFEGNRIVKWQINILKYFNGLKFSIKTFGVTQANYTTACINYAFKGEKNINFLRWGLYWFYKLFVKENVSNIESPPLPIKQFGFEWKYKITNFFQRNGSAQHLCYCLITFVFAKTCFHLDLLQREIKSLSFEVIQPFTKCLQEQVLFWACLPQTCPETRKNLASEPPP